MSRAKHWISLLLLLLAGCRSYQPQLPETPIPAVWKEILSYDKAFEEKNRFWELFEDPVLNELEQRAIAANFDLQIAASRILQARSLILKEHGARLPEAHLDAAVTEDEMLLNPRSSGSPTRHVERARQQQYSLLGGFSYELDFWGKLKDREKSACRRWEASQWEYEFIYQTVVTDVAIHYFTLRTLEEEMTFLERALDLWKETVALHQSRVEAGLDPALELSRAQLELARVEVEIEQAKRQRSLQENNLANLLGTPPSSWKIVKGHLPDQLPALPAVLPSDLLKRRADIQSASALASAGRLDVDVALKQYFPSFPLTASVGLASPFLSDFFEWQARYWGYALNALQPLFDGGRRKADVQGAKARFTEHFALYQKTVIQAFRDVEDALSTLRHTQLQLEAQRRAVDAAIHTASLVQQQFHAGLISYLLVADAEKTAISVEKYAIALKGQNIVAWIRLMKALGLQKEEAGNKVQATVERGHF